MLELLKYLPLNLQCFAADTGGGAGGDGDGNEGGNDNGGNPSDGKRNTDKNDAKEIMIPKSRFDEVNNAYKKLKEELDAIKAAQKQKEKEEAEKRGEFENLYNQTKTDLESVQEEYKAAKERIETLEGVINQLLKAKLENIDKEYHDLIPENMSPEEKLAWVSNAEKKGLFVKREQKPLGEPTNPKGNKVDLNKISNPFEMLLAGYRSK